VRNVFAQITRRYRLARLFFRSKSYFKTKLK